MTGEGDETGKETKLGRRIKEGGNKIKREKCLWVIFFTVVLLFLFFYLLL